MSCPVHPDAGVVRAVLGSVDCGTRDFAHRGYELLTGGAAFQAGLTAILTIYVALVGWRMLFASDGARLADGPRMALKVGAVLALVSSWNLFEVLVFDVAAKAPDEIAALIAPTHGRPDPVGDLQVAWDQLTASSAAFASSAAPNPATLTPQQPQTQPDAPMRKAAAESLATAAQSVLTLHAGLVAAADLAVGVLTAVGPIFVVLLLLRETRGFFEGWVRTLAAAALISLTAWTLILLMGVVLRPWLIELARQREASDLDPNTGMTAAGLVFVFGAGQIALAVGAAVIAFGFRLWAPWRLVTREGRAAPAPAAATPPPAMISRPSLLADQMRRLDVMTAERTRASEVAAGVSRLRVVRSEPATLAVASPYRRADSSRDHLGRKGR
jgi:type IV secretion system protein VirB6